MGLKTSGRYLDMIRKERNNEKGRQPLPADCGGWDSYREAVSYIQYQSINHRVIFSEIVATYPKA